MRMPFEPEFVDQSLAELDADHASYAVLTASVRRQRPGLGELPPRTAVRGPARPGARWCGGDDLDQVLGQAAAAAGTPGMTGTLTVRYRRPTPLGDCTVEARAEESDGTKTTVRGELRNAAGETTAAAEGLFVLPRWAREAIQKRATRPTRFE